MTRKLTPQYKRTLVCPICGKTYQAVRAYTCGRTRCLQEYHRKRKIFAEKLSNLPLPFKWEEIDNANDD